MTDLTEVASAGERSSPAPSQTLSRGVQILEILADSATALPIAEVARRLDVHRSIAYRLVRTLEDHGLVARNSSGHLLLGVRMAALAAGVARDLQAEALPELTAAANELGVTSFLAVLDQFQCVTLVSVEPRHAAASMAQRPGARHPITVGAPGKAIMSLLSEAEWPQGVTDRLRADVANVSARGYATSHDEVIPTVHSVAVPLLLRSRPPAAISVVYVGSHHDPEVIAARLQRAADTIRGALGH